MDSTPTVPADAEVRDALEELGIDMHRVERIPLSLLVPSRYQPRKIFDQKRLEELGEALKGGQIETAIVNKLPNGKYEMLAGERRWRALDLIGRKTIRAVVVEISDPKILARLAGGSNSHRVDLSILEKLDHARMLRDEGMELAEIAAVFGDNSVQWVSNLLTLDRLHGKLRSKLANTLSMGVGLQLIRLAVGEQLSAYRKLDGGSEKKARRIIDDLLDAGATPHPDAQDRSSVTEAFLRCVEGNLAAADANVRGLTTASRKTRLGKLERGDADKVRKAIEGIKQSLQTLVDALPA